MSNYISILKDIEVSISDYDIFTTDQFRNISGIELIEKLKQVNVGDKNGSHFLRTTLKVGANGKLLARNSNNINEKAWLLIIDADTSIDIDDNEIDGAPDPRKIIQSLIVLGYAYVIYGTYSYYLGKVGYRYRIILISNQPYSKSQLQPILRHVVTQINSHIEGNKLAYATENHCYPQGWNFARKPRNSTLPHLYFENMEGNTVDIIKFCEFKVEKTEQHKKQNKAERGSVIDDFNEQNDVRDLLTRYSYKFVYSNTEFEKWLSPESTSGEPGISVDIKNNKFYSHHNDIFNDGYWHSPFDLMKIKEGLSQDEALARIAKIAVASDVHSVFKHDFSKIDSETWTTPLPITPAVVGKLVYPINSLPSPIRDAVNEVNDFTQAPIPLITSSALAASSLACQTYLNVKRADNLCGPISLFLITVADSGERKSTCDGYFMDSIHKYEKEQAMRGKSLMKEHQAIKTIQDATLKSLKSKLDRHIKSNTNTEQVEIAINKLLYSQPLPPRIPRLIYTDITPEALKANLATSWPSGGIISSEGGIILGSCGMAVESRMRNLSTYNEGWDGKGIPTDRISSGSFNVQAIRLTIGIQVQEPTLNEFIHDVGTLARGIGFFARSLFGFPESTQGTRFFKEAPTKWIYLDKFNLRITDILNIPPPVDQYGILTPRTINFTPEAKQEWIKYYDNIEKNLAPDAIYCDVRDVGSKAADNAARLSAIFHIIENGLEGEISSDNFVKAGEIVLWHLNESRLFFDKMRSSEDLKEAKLLDKWLIKHCKNNNNNKLPISVLQQNGPNCLRRKYNLEGPLQLLIKCNRVRLTAYKQNRIISVNPMLLTEQQ